MGNRSGRWAWSKVGTVHTAGDGESASCTGEVYSYAYRCYPPSDSSYERCIGLAWCSTCREYTGGVVHVARDESLPDALVDLPTAEREQLARSEVRLLDYLDRLVRHGLRPRLRP